MRDPNEYEPNELATLKAEGFEWDGHFDFFRCGSLATLTIRKYTLSWVLVIYRNKGKEREQVVTDTLSQMLPVIRSTDPVV